MKKTKNYALLSFQPVKAALALNTPWTVLAMVAFCLGCLLSGDIAQAEPVNLLKIALTNNAPSITTMPSDTSLGGSNITLTMYNAAGTAADLAGLAGSGVNGAVSGAAAMSLTNGETGAAGTSANNNGAANCAADKADANLAFGTITNFVLTFWFNEAVALNDTSGETLPRIFVLDAAGGTDDTANSIGLKFQLGNQFELEINNATTTTGNSYGAPANTASLGTTYAAGFPPANKWVFVAWVYDGTNIYQYTGTDSSVTTLQNQFSAAGLSVNLGSAPYLFVGNRGISGTRGFFGWMEDVRFYSGVSTNNLNFVENIRKTIAPHVPAFTGIYPDGTALQQATNKFVFTATAPSGFNLTNLSLLVNGVNVSSSLTFVTNGSGSTNVTASYVGLPQNAIGTAVFSATDSLGLNATANVTFDTFSPTNFMIKAEEFDFNGGQYINNPDYTDGNPADANSYYGLSSVEEVDTHKGPSVGDNANDYRYDDGSGNDTQTPVATGELAVPRIVNAPLDGSGNPQVNHIISDWSSGEWQNYTKTFPAGNYNVWARLSTTSGSTVNFDQVTSGQGTTSQTTSRLGQFTLSGTGFQWVELMQNGSPAVVNLSGVNTVRATTGGGAAADLYMFVAANPNLPTISNVNPNGAFLFQYPTGGKLTFTVSSPTTTINTANVVVTLNGVNVSSSVTYTGGPSTWNATYSGLVPNQTYAITIHVTDGNGNSANAQLTIDTWQPVLQFEAEDFDFDPSLSPIPNGTGNRFINSPVPTSVPTTLGTYAVLAANSYEGQTGDDAPVYGTGQRNAINGIDQYGAGAGTRPYRPGDVATAVVVDTPRAQFANHQDFNIGFLGAGFWENYTRTWPAGTYNLYARVASGASASGLPTPPGIRDDVDLVLGGYGTTNQITEYLGTFNIPTTNGYSSYMYIPLIDRYGNYAQLSLSGVETLRSMLDLTTTAGVAQFGLNVNFYMLTAPRTDLPRIDDVYPNGLTLDQQSSSFSFVASSPEYGINTTNIQLTLNGTNVSSSLTFTGASGSWTVTYPGLQPNTFYTAVMTITDNDGQSHSTTVTFDTFSPNNYTWEAEDFDFDPSYSPISDGSTNRFIDYPVPTASPASNSYYGQSGDPGIDYANIFGNTKPGPAGDYVFRSFDNIACAPTTDVLRPQYIDAQLAATNNGITDYEVDFWDAGGWINYTRTFPTGKFYVYARVSAGNGPFALQFAQVTSGAGTGTQTTQYLGAFTNSGTSFTTWQYVPLVNTNTGQPVVLSLGGVETFQVTGDDNEDVNFFSLVPVVPLRPTVTAALNESQVVISFPTQNGYHYTVYYKNKLTDPTWTPLGAAQAGNGSVETMTDNIGTTRFYIVGVQ